MPRSIKPIRACSRSPQANDGGHDGEECGEAGVGFAAARSDASVSLELSAEIFDHVAPLAGVAVELCREAAVEQLLFEPDRGQQYPSARDRTRLGRRFRCRYFDADSERRALQQEHAAHMRLQAQIDRQAIDGALGDPSDPTFLRALHRDFFDGATDEALTIRHAGQGVRLMPGEWRDGEVEIGEHVPPPHATVPAFMDHFHKRFRLNWLHGQVARVLAMATAHLRFNYIHPFYDGNGRVSRLMSHAMAHHAGIAAGGLWSGSRGLARGLEDGLPGREEYRRMMMVADRVRQGDRDGRGALSLAALTSFTTWFLAVCEDQVRFMSGMFACDTLGARLARYAAVSDPGGRAGELLRIILLRGEVERGDVAALLGVAPHHDETVAGRWRAGIGNAARGPDAALP